MLRVITLAILAIAPVVVFPLAALVQGARGNEGVQNEATKKFQAFLAQDWKRWMQDYPEMATGVGYPGQNRKWTDNSPAGIAAREKHLQQSLDALKKIERASLPASEQLNYDLYEELLGTTTEGLKYGDDPMPFRGVIPGNRCGAAGNFADPGGTDHRMDAGRTETRIYAAKDHDARLAKAACRPDSERRGEKPSVGSFS